MAKKWEYSVHLVLKNKESQPDLVQQKLNELGKQGWELVSVTAVLMTTTYDNQYLFFLKREIT